MELLDRYLRQLHDAWGRFLDEAVEEPAPGGLIETLRNLEEELTAPVRGLAQPRPAPRGDRPPG